MKSAAALSTVVLSLCALEPNGAALAVESSTQTPTRQQRIDALTRQMSTIQEQLQALAEQNKALLDAQAKLQAQLDADRHPPEHSVAALNDAVAPDRPSGLAPALPSPEPGGAAPIPVVGSGGTLLPGGLRLWGYGEVYYSRPSRVPARAQADLARAVFGLGYSIDEKTEFNSEFELEHAIASSTDPGEFEIEQFYVDRRINDSVAVRAGLFLMPFGLLNEYHEPTYFYGVNRNFVETLIIPDTWREGGANLHGSTPIGLSWNAGVTTGIDLAKWNFAPEFPPYLTALDLLNNSVAPLQASHQQLALANAHSLSEYLSLGYRGVPGMTLGVAATTGKANPVAGTVGNQRATLWEGHARWTPGNFDFAALYARGAIGNAAAANMANPGSPNPIPSNFYGYFVQAAYDAWTSGDYRLAPFTRWERYDMASHYAGVAGSPVPSGLVPLSSTPGDYGFWPRSHDRVWTVGANFYTTPHVVFKADYQWFHTNVDFNRFDLGLGVNF